MMNIRAIMLALAASAGMSTPVLAQCGILGLLDCGYELPPEVRSLDRISASSVVDQFKDGAKFCNRPNNQAGTCRAVQTLRTVNADGITVSYLEGEPYSVKILMNVRLFLKDNMLCRPSSGHLASTRLYRASDGLAEISDYDTLVPADKQEEFRRLMQSDIEEGREYCWSYWAVPSDDLKSKMVLVTYLDGVLQPFDPDSTAAFFTKGSNLGLYND